MKQQFTCNSCGGTYYAVQDDGALYMHSCPMQYDPAKGLWSSKPDARIERIIMDARGRANRITAEGKGVTPVSPNTGVAPGWIMALYSATERE